ncbi:MAG: hypothetical protein AMK75_06385 [Planctomycetes bacterium SM23_65]|nr:MAG: hypothetical protein AMK75_06385 [Planctomycetes bacterium SM23_65]
MKRFLAAAVLHCVMLSALVARAEMYYVATDGSNANPGTAVSPWRTVQKAANIAGPGDTVCIRSGTYNERVVLKKSGTLGKTITFKNDRGHKPVLDGSGKAGWWGVISLHGTDHVRLEGLTVRKNSKGWGVLVEHAKGNAKDAATHIQLVGLEVHDTGGECIQIRGNVHDVLIDKCVVHGSAKYSGIDIYQWGGGRPHHVTVRGCTAYGFPRFAGIASEQADDLTVENNSCRDCALGLDIGSGDRNVIRRNTITRCENGIALSSNEDSHVYENIVHDVSEAFYAYYWSAHGEAHARNRWYRNVVYNATWAIYEMNSKMTRKAKEGPTSGHEYANNFFYNVGGRNDYRSPFWWRGVNNIRFHHNTVSMKANHDVFELTKGSNGASFRNNIVCVSGKAKVFDINDGSDASVDYNCYWNRTRAAAVIGRHDIVRDPRFVNVGAGDFRLKGESPAKGAGSDGKDMGVCDWKTLPKK